MTLDQRANRLVELLAGDGIPVSHTEARDLIIADFVSLMSRPGVDTVCGRV